MKAYEKNLTVGSELPAIVMFTLPMLAGNLFQQLYNVVDSVIVGKYLGSDALAAVGSTGSITYLFYTLCLGLGTGAGILTAQHYGAGDDDRVKKTIVNSAYVIGGFAVAISIISVLAAKWLLTLLNTPASILDEAAGYMRISCAGTIAVAAYNWIAFILRSLGDSRNYVLAKAVRRLLQRDH